MTILSLNHDQSRTSQTSGAETVNFAHPAKIELKLKTELKYEETRAPDLNGSVRKWMHRPESPKSFALIPVRHYGTGSGTVISQSRRARRVAE